MLEQMQGRGGLVCPRLAQTNYVAKAGLELRIFFHSLLSAGLQVCVQPVSTVHVYDVCSCLHVCIQRPKASAGCPAVTFCLPPLTLNVKLGWQPASPDGTSVTKSLQHGATDTCSHTGLLTGAAEISAQVHTLT